MAKQEGILVSAVVVEALPNANFTVRLGNGHIVLAHICGKMRRDNIKVLPDDRVDVEITPYDLNRGIIKWRHKV